MLVLQETFSNVGERRKKAEESRNRHDFTSLSVEEIARGYQVGPVAWGLCFLSGGREMGGSLK